jgi:uncharacterized protein YjbJ (UPF0337 family)
MPDIEEVKGKVKEAAGSVVGDKSMEREGDAQQEKAQAQPKSVKKLTRTKLQRQEAGLRAGLSACYCLSGMDRVRPELKTRPDERD